MTREGWGSSRGSLQPVPAPRRWTGVPPRSQCALASHSGFLYQSVFRRVVLCHSSSVAWRGTAPGLRSGGRPVGEGHGRLQSGVFQGWKESMEVQGIQALVSGAGAGDNRAFLGTVLSPVAPSPSFWGSPSAGSLRFEDQSSSLPVQRKDPSSGDSPGVLPTVWALGRSAASDPHWPQAAAPARPPEDHVST